MLVFLGLARYLVAVVVALVASLTAFGAPQASAAEKVGVVLMHGEQGAPGRVIDGLAVALEKAGYLVGRPDICWSARRSYEATFNECLAAIDDAIVKLKNLGATSIVVGGLSLGGNAAIAFGAGHPGLLGIIALAPSHDARAMAESADIADSVTRARQLVVAGKGEESISLSDVAFGPGGAYTIEVATTPAIYLTFFGPASPAVIPDNTPRLIAPLLWVAGVDDPTQPGGADDAFAGAPANPLSRYVVVASGRQDTPEKSKDAVLVWLKDLAVKDGR
jgi:pimeloyl-ACP methyl ester carboxylesterase